MNTFMLARDRELVAVVKKVTEAGAPARAGERRAGRYAPGADALGRSTHGQPVQDFKRYYANAELVTNQNRQSDEYLKVTANPAQVSAFGDSVGPALLENIVLGATSHLTNEECAGVTYSNRLDLEYVLDFIDSIRQP